MIHKQLTSERVAFCALACRVRPVRISAESAPSESSQKQQQHKRESLQVSEIALSSAQDLLSADAGVQYKSLPRISHIGAASKEQSVSRASLRRCS